MQLREIADPTEFQRFVMYGKKRERFVYWVGELAREALWGFGVDRTAARHLQSLSRLGYEQGVLHLFQKRMPDGKMHYIAEHR